MCIIFSYLSISQVLQKTFLEIRLHNSIKMSGVLKFNVGDSPIWYVVTYMRTDDSTVNNNLLILFEINFYVRVIMRRK